MKPHSPACDRNQEPILAVLRQYFGDRRHVLELGSGTGQHAVHFAAGLPWLQWQASDAAAALPGIQAWREDAALANLPPPLTLQAVPDAGLQPPPALPADADGRGFDAVFSANTLHIMGWPQVQALFSALAAMTRPQALLAIYGPFKVGGQYTSESNRAFDGWLAREYPDGGLRDIEAVHELALAAGFEPIANFAMPANNQFLLWRRGGPRTLAR
jgi:SAM-dependent methyltransferase